jgi:hypothetical protein
MISYTRVSKEADRYSGHPENSGLWRTYPCTRELQTGPSPLGLLNGRDTLQDAETLLRDQAIAGLASGGSFGGGAQCSPSLAHWKQSRLRWVAGKRNS